MRGLLDAVSREPTVTQRRLSRELGVALGVANAVLRRCVVKGLIKIKQAPIRRYGYYLTPLGFTEKSRLTLEYLNLSFQLFRDAREQYAAIFTGLSARGLRRIVLAGAGELAEIALLSAHSHDIAIVGLVEARGEAPALPNIETHDTLAGFAGRFDAIVVTDMRAPSDAHRKSVEYCAANGLPHDCVAAPALLRIAVETPSRQVTP